MNISPLLFCQYKIYTPLSRLLVQIYNFSRDETQGDLKKKSFTIVFFYKINCSVCCKGEHRSHC